MAAAAMAAASVAPPFAERPIRARTPLSRTAPSRGKGGHLEETCRSLPFGRLAGIEGLIAADCQRRQLRCGDLGDNTNLLGSGRGDDPPARHSRRPHSAGAQWRRRWSAVSRTFDLRADEAPPDRCQSSFGPHHKANREKIVQLLEQDLQERRERAERARDGQLRRKEAEAAMGVPTMRPSGSCALFSDTALLATSESAVKWYLEHGQGDTSSGMKYTKASTGPVVAQGAAGMALRRSASASATGRQAASAGA